MHDTHLTDLELRQHFQQWCQKNSALLEAIEKQECALKSIWPQLGRDGLLGVMIPEEFGGCHLDLGAFVNLLDVVAYYSPSLALSILAHSLLIADPINQHGTSQQKSAYLAKLCSGEIIGCTGISEDNAGSDALAMRCQLQKSGDDFILNGHKMWITNGPIADIALIYCKNENQQIQAAITHLGSQEKDPALDKFGMRASPTGRLTFTNTLIRGEDVLPCCGKDILKTGLDKERIALASIPIGIMRRALDEVIAHTSIRKQFGTPLASKQITQAKIATMHAKLASAQALMAQALHEKTDKKASKLAANTLYLVASENATDVASTAMDLFGAMGYMQESQIPKLLQDAKLFQTGGGTEAVRQLIIGHLLTGHRAY